MSKLGAGIENEFDPSPVVKRLSDPDRHPAPNDILGLCWADSKTLWTVEEGGRVVIWNAQEKKVVLIKDILLDDPALIWRLDPLLGMGFAASGDLNAFDIPTGKALWNEEQESWITAITSGTVRLLGKTPKPHLLCGHDDGSISLHRPKDGMLVELPDFPKSHAISPISAVGISPCETRIAIADEKRSIWILNLTSGNWFELSNPKDTGAHKSRIIGLEWYPGKNGEPTLFSASWDGTVRVWDLEKRLPKILLNSHQGPVLAMGYANRSHGKRPRFVSSDEGSCLHLWDCSNWNLVGLPIDLGSPARQVAISPQGNHLAWADNSRAIHLISLESLEKSSSEHIGFDPADPRSLRNDLAMDPVSQILIHRQSNGDIRLLSPDLGEQISLEFPGESASAMAVTRKGDWIWLSPVGKNPGFAEPFNPNPTSRVLGLRKVGKDGWQVEQIIESGIWPITSISISPEGTLLALGSHLTDLVEIWTIPEGVPYHFICEDWAGQTVQSLAFGKNGNLVIGTIDPMATGGTPGHTFLWSETGGKPIDQVPARVLCWNQSSEILGRIDLLGRAWIFRTHSKENGFVFLGEATGSWQVMAFAPDAHCLALGGATQVSLFDLKKDKWLGSVELPCPARALWFDESVENLWVALKSDECILVSMEPWLAEAEWIGPEPKT